MNAVAAAAVSMFCSLDSPVRVPSSVALHFSLNSSLSPTLSKSLDLSVCKYECRRRKGIAEAVVSSFSTDSDDEAEELGFGSPGPGAEGSQFRGRRNVTRRFAGEEAASEARVSGASRAWVPQKQNIRGSRLFDGHRAGGSLAPSKGAPPFCNHDTENPVANNRERNIILYGEQQHHAYVEDKKLPKVPLPTKNQHLRMHNKVSAFESVKQPFVSKRSSSIYTDALSWGVEDEDVAPNFKGEVPDLYEDFGQGQNYAQLSTEYGNKENVQKGTKFMSELVEVLSSLTKKDDLLRKNLAVKQKVLRDEKMLTLSKKGLQTATYEGKKAKESRVTKSLETSEKVSAKFIDSHIERSASRYTNRTSARDDLRGLSFMNHRKRLQSEPGEARSSLKENTSMDDGAVVTSFNLFSSSPAVPWEADRKYESSFKPNLPIKRGNVRTLARLSFKSVGSRSSPSRSSDIVRDVYRPKLELNAATSVMDPLKRIEGAEQGGSQLYIREDIMVKDNNSLSINQSMKDNMTKVPASTASSFSALSSDSDSEANEDNDSLIELDVENASLSEIDSLKQSYQKENSVDSGNLDAKDAESTAFDSTENSLHNMKETLPSSTVHSDAVSAEFHDKMALGASEMSNGSKHPHFASWHKHDSPDLPFDFQFSYTETPKAPLLGYREIPYSPFGPSTMGRPWTGNAPPNPSKKKKRVFDSFNPPPKDKKGVKFVEDPGPYPEGEGPKPAKTREELLGEPLTKEEIIYLVEKCERESRQLNLGRDGLTHNMLDLIHCHWKRRRVCKIKCRGVPTLDMDNVKFHIEDKTQGKIIYQAGGVLYLFRGRNYNYKDRPQIPLMIWKPATPVYPKLIQPAPEGLTIEEALRLRALGRKIQPLCRIGKNGVYLNLVKDVRAAFKLDELVRIDCQGLYPRDYRKIGGKLKDLVPCVLLSFGKDYILLWRGKQNLANESSSLSHPPTLDPYHVSEEISKESSVIATEENDGSVCEEHLDVSADEASSFADASEGEAQGRMQQTSEQEIGSTLDYGSQDSAHSVDSRDLSVLETVKEQVQSSQADVFHETMLSSSTKDEDHALTDTEETKYVSSSKLPKGETSEASFANSPLMGDEFLLPSVDLLPERHATKDRKHQQETESEGLDFALEEINNPVASKLDKDDDEELIQLEAKCEEEDGLVSDEEVNAFEEINNSVASKLEEDDDEESIQLEVEHEGEDGLVSDEVNEVLDDQSDDDDDDVVHLDELWDHAFSSGMAIELPEEGMDADLIVREAAKLAKIAPLGPTYTIKLRYKLQIKKHVQRPDDYLHVPFGRGKPRKIPKKVVKRKPQLPTLDVPGMGGLPVDELAMLLAPDQAPSKLRAS